MGELLQANNVIATTYEEKLQADEQRYEKLRKATEATEADRRQRYEAAFTHDPDAFIDDLGLNREWLGKAACKNLAKLFYPPDHFERKNEKLERERRAKAVCATCSVREQCLAEAVRLREPHGIWGGLNESERKQLY